MCAYCTLKNETMRITVVIRIGTYRANLLVGKKRKFRTEIKRRGGMTVQEHLASYWRGNNGRKIEAWWESYERQVLRWGGEGRERERERGIGPGEKVNDKSMMRQVRLSFLILGYVGYAAQDLLLCEDSIELSRHISWERRWLNWGDFAWTDFVRSNHV